MDINDYEKCFNTTHTNGPCGPKCIHTLSDAKFREMLKKVLEARKPK